MVECPECGSELSLEEYDLDAGETVNCPECAVELRVVTTAPLVVTTND